MDLKNILKVKLFKVNMSWRSVLNCVQVLLSGHVAEGPQVKLFEGEFEATFKVPYCVAVNSGTTALELAYHMSDIQKGQEVIVPVLTCTATNVPLVRRGAKLVFADVAKDSLNASVADIEKKITSKTKAIVFVLFGGNLSGIYELWELINKKNLKRKTKIKLIVDAAQSVNFDFNADFICVSFQAIKIITCGDGGMLICRNEQDYQQARKLRWFGYDREEKQRCGDIDLELAGYKYHMNDISAAIGRGNLAQLENLVNHRLDLAGEYKVNLRIPILNTIWLAIVMCPHSRTELIQYLKECGIETGLHHYRNDKYTIFGGKKLDLPRMDAIEDQYLLLPFHNGMNKLQVKYICKLINDFYHLEP